MKTPAVCCLLLLFSVPAYASDNDADETGHFIFYQDVSWSPDGKRLLLSRMDIRDDSYEYRIYAVNADGSGYSRVTEGPGDKWTSWFPDGSRFAYSSATDGNTDIFIAENDGRSRLRLTDDPAADTHPSVSPDGTRIAFMSERDGSSQIYVMNADGSDVTRRSGGPGEKWNPRWSPDASQIVFYGAAEAGQDSIYVMDARGSNLRTLGAGIWPSWSTDGSQLLFVWEDDIYEMTLGGSGKTKLVGNAYFATWSPDGAKIAFARNVRRAPGGWPAASSVFLVNADGSGEERLTEK